VSTVQGRADRDDPLRAGPPVADGRDGRPLHHQSECRRQLGSGRPLHTPHGTVDRSPGRGRPRAGGGPWAAPRSSSPAPCSCGRSRRALRNAACAGKQGGHPLDCQRNMHVGPIYTEIMATIPLHLDRQNYSPSLQGNVRFTEEHLRWMKSNF